MLVWPVPNKIKTFFLSIFFSFVIISCTVTKNYTNPERPEFSGNFADHFEHVIIGGDFNTNTENGVRETEKLFTQAGFLRASKRVGATSKVDLLGLSDFELGHIFVKGLIPITCGKCEDAQSSDHFPVWVTLQLQK